MKTLLSTLLGAVLVLAIIGCSHREGPSRPMAVAKVTLFFGAAPEQFQSWTFTNNQFIAQIATLNSATAPSCIYVGSMDVVDLQGARRTFHIFHVHDPAKIRLGEDAAVKNGREFLAFLAQQGFPTNIIFDYDGK
jgi:hypothetical protein